MIAKVLCSRKSSTLVRKGVEGRVIGVRWTGPGGGGERGGGRARGPVLSVPEGQY